MLSVYKRLHSDNYIFYLGLKTKKGVGANTFWFFWLEIILTYDTGIGFYNTDSSLWYNFKIHTRIARKCLSNVCQMSVKI